MASLDVWLEGDLGETLNWHLSDVPVDMSRYHYDVVYTHLVDSHVQQVMEHLSREIAEIATMTPRVEDYDWTHCE